MREMKSLKKDNMNIRKEFPGLNNDLVYLDNSASLQKSAVVIDGIAEFSRNAYANVHRGLYPLSVHATERYEDARVAVGSLIDANPDQIIFTRGTTESINLIANTVEDLLEGDTIVVTAIEHHANLIPWQQLAKRKNLQLKVIPLIKSGDDYDIDYDKAEKIINKKTAIVSVTHISNVLGIVVNVARLKELANKNGAIFVIDAAQSIGHMKLHCNMADFIAFSSHKIGGPSGIGALYGRKDLLEKMKPYQVGGDMIKKVTYQESTWADVPAKFEAGTPAIEAAIGFAIASRYISDLGYDNIVRMEKELSAYMLQKLKEIDSIKLFRGKNSIGIFSFSMDGIHPHDIADILGSKGICVRAGHHCCMPLMGELGVPALTRASLWAYNSKSDVDKFIDGLKGVQKMFEGGRK